MNTSSHNYGTRIRKNSVLKPSARLRQCPPSPHPPPRKIKPVPIPAAHSLIPPSPDLCFPLFPIPGVMLHPEDASNKVFHAIGRSFLSVENRAMTIKDLAEMTLKFGLMCQNVSAASQAITTYIRNHMARCETQEDHPLLLRHVLSGTLADDDLVPALYSRIGGATNPAKPNQKDLGLNVVQHTLEGERLTNFRRGTMVWYLSKATGVSCPFARAGIRLCEYGKEGRRVANDLAEELQQRPKKHAGHDDAQCGEKRKRLRRGCRRGSDGSRDSSSVPRDSESPAIDSGYGELGADSSDDERPPKVKLMLRLRPSLPLPAVASRPREVIDLSNDTSSSSEDGADDGDDAEIRPDPPEAPWSLPPYPRRSITVPHYTPSCDERVPSPSFSTQQGPDKRRRSPSVPCSASPPPDSDHDDFDLDLDSDVDWDTSSLSVPSPALRVKVETTDGFQPFKPEPADIRDMLDAWEDLDCAQTSTVSSATVKLPATDDPKFDGLEFWEWEFESGWAGAREDHQDFPVVKMEPDENECLPSFRAFAPGFPVSPYSPFTPSSLHSTSSPLSEPGAGSLTSQSPLSPFAVPPSPSSLPSGIDRRSSALAWQDAELLGPDSVHPHEFEGEWVSGMRMHVDCNSLPQRASEEAVSSPLSIGSERCGPDDTCNAVEETDSCRESRVRQAHSSLLVDSNPVVVRTCRPCTPDISATQIEGISVYQTMLDSTLLLRRIDTDFVNLSTILSHLSLSPPSPLPNVCVDVSHPSLSINGLWAPLSVARMYSHGLPRGIESIFLSDNLVMRFPTALQDFYQKSAPGRSLSQFGPNFNASRLSPKAGQPFDLSQSYHGKSVKEDVWEGPVGVGLEEPLLTIPPSVNLALEALHPPTPTQEVAASPEIPLSPTEQEIFRALCIHPDWDPEEAEVMGSVGSIPSHSPPRERPLRRSRRVADAVAARSRVAPPRTKGRRHTSR